MLPLPLLARALHRPRGEGELLLGALVQFWRIFTNFALFGKLSLNFVFQMFILCVTRARGREGGAGCVGRRPGERVGVAPRRTNYSHRLEADCYPSGGGTGRGTLADYAWMIFLGSVFLNLVGGVLMGMYSMASPLMFMVVYVWAQRVPHEEAVYWGFSIARMYVPWAMMLVHFLLSGGQPPVQDLLGIAAGHVYFMLVDYLPSKRGMHVLHTPDFIYRLLDVPNPNVTRNERQPLFERGFQGQGHRVA